MSPSHIAALGAIAGLTIFIGLPVGRLRAKLESTRTVLNAIAVGVLVFLLWDILAHGWEPVDAAIGEGDTAAAIGYGVVLVGGLGVGLVGLVWFDQWVARRTARVSAAVSAGGGTAGGTDVAATATELGWRGLWAQPAGRLAVLIAIGIGLHNFAEGLAIGSSAASGEVTLAWLLVIGFAPTTRPRGSASWHRWRPPVSVRRGPSCSRSGSLATSPRARHRRLRGDGT